MPKKVSGPLLRKESLFGNRKTLELNNVQEKTGVGNYKPIPVHYELNIRRQALRITAFPYLLKVLRLFLKT